MDRIFEALASTARRQILAYLSAGELSAGELAERFDFSKPALSSHLRILEEAGLIEREKRGQFVYFRQVPDRLANTLFSWAVLLGADDRHLRFRSSVRVQRRSDGHVEISLGSRVQTLNAFGSMYMALIDAGHRHYVAPALLRRAVEHALAPELANVGDPAAHPANC